MVKGTVKWFNREKGYGFITSETGEEIFVHHTAIIQKGFRALDQGDEVTFEITKGNKGPQASNVSKS
jgi:cold shock protein